MKSKAAGANVYSWSLTLLNLLLLNLGQSFPMITSWIRYFSTSIEK